MASEDTDIDLGLVKGPTCLEDRALNDKDVEPLTPKSSTFESSYLTPPMSSPVIEQREPLRRNSLIADLPSPNAVDIAETKEPTAAVQESIKTSTIDDDPDNLESQSNDSMCQASDAGHQPVGSNFAEQKSDDSNDHYEHLYELTVDADGPLGNWDHQPTFSPEAPRPVSHPTFEITDEQIKLFRAATKQLMKDTTQEHSTSGLPEYSLKGFNHRLYAYQLVAVAKLRQLSEKPKVPNGGILALEMGLGKTAIMLAYLADKYNRGEPIKALIIVPSHLMSQWRSEIENFLEKGIAKSCVLRNSTHNPNSNAGFILENSKIIITSYNITQGDYVDADTKSKKRVSTATQGLLFTEIWTDIILDEGTNINNYETKTCNAVLELQSQHRWVLTGTPARNSINDYFSYLRFICIPEARSIHEFSLRFTDPASPKTGNAALKKVLRKIMIRMELRTRLFGRPLLELPALERKWVEVTPTDLEHWLYNAISSLLMASVKGEARKLKGKKPRALNAVQSQRKAAVSLCLVANFFRLVLDERKQDWDNFNAWIIASSQGILSNKTDSSNMRQLFRRVGSPKKKVANASVLQHLQHECKTHSSNKGIRQMAKFLPISSKMQKIKECLQDCINNTDEKIVIFCDFTDCIRLIKRLCLNEGWWAATYYGKMPTTMKDANLREFRTNEKTRILIASMKCAATGLNLEFASTVLIVDLWWNDALQDQACARVYRHGQTRDVRMFLFLTKGTIDEHLRDVQTGKTKLLSDTLENQNAFATEDGQGNESDAGVKALCEDMAKQAADAKLPPLSEEQERLINLQLRQDESRPKKRSKPSDSPHQNKEILPRLDNLEDELDLSLQSDKKEEIDFEALKQDAGDDEADISSNISSEEDEDEYVPNKKAKKK